MKATEKTMDTIVSLCKARGFIFPGSEIYGGLSNSWDYGPLGVEFKNNVKKAWWKKFVQESPTNVGVDAAILMNPQVWVATGHVGGFSDPLMDCKDCKTRHRADKLIEDFTGESADGWSNEKMMDFIKEHHIQCPNCGSENFTDIRQFNLMFKTFQGVTEDQKNEIYLRPETAQGIFVNFPAVQRTTRKKLPLALPRWARVSATRSPPATSPSAPGSLSRWSWSSSASPTPIWSGSSIGRTSARSGSSPWV